MGLLKKPNFVYSCFMKNWFLVERVIPMQCYTWLLYYNIKSKEKKNSKGCYIWMHLCIDASLVLYLKSRMDTFIHIATSLITRNWRQCSYINYCTIFMFNYYFSCYLSCTLFQLLWPAAELAKNLSGAKILPHYLISCHI